MSEEKFDVVYKKLEESIEEQNQLQSTDLKSVIETVEKVKRLQEIIDELSSEEEIATFSRA